MYEKQKGKCNIMCYLGVVLLETAAVPLCVARFGLSLKAVMASVLFLLLLIVAFIDMKTMRIPDFCNGMILILGIVALPILGPLGFSSRIWGLLAVSVPMLLFTGLVPRAFGGGDIKLMAAAGFLLGWRLNLAAFFTGLFSGGIYGSFLLLLGKAGRKDSIALGPFLCLGIALAILFGEGV